MKRWFTQHARALARTSAKLVRSPFTTLFNVAVLGITIALPAGLYVALANLQSAARAAAPEPQLTVFLALDASRQDLIDIDTRLKRHPAVAYLSFVPRADALETLKDKTGIARLTESLGGNPLPDAFIVNARDRSPAALQRLRAEMAAWPKVASVQLDSEWAQRLDALVKLARLALMLLATLLALALVAVTFNTIRLQILTQRAEIEVATLIGATDAFIRRPFLYQGALLGTLAGAVACATVAGATGLLNRPLADLARLYGSEWQLAFLAPADVAAVVLFAAALGWLGAWLSVAGHLAEAR